MQVNPIPFDVLKTKIQDKFNFKICLDDPYKLCDFKPAYGYIFEEYLREYDLWGFIDIDLILGRIADFIPSETLQEFDIIGCHGHFTLFCNNEHVNNFFMTEPKSGEVGFDKAFSARHCFHFDESGLIANASQYGLRVCDCGSFFDVMPNHYQFLLMNGPKFDKCVVHYSNGVLHVYHDDEGNLVSHELLYVHFQKRDMQIAAGLNCKGDFLAVPNMFVSIREEITITLIHKYNPTRIYWDWYKKRFQQIRTNIRNGAIKERLSKLLRKG